MALEIHLKATVTNPQFVPAAVGSGSVHSGPVPPPAAPLESESWREFRCMLIRWIRCIQVPSESFVLSLAQFELWATGWVLVLLWRHVEY